MPFPVLPRGTGPRCVWAPQVWWGDADSVLRLKHWQQRRDEEELPRITHVCNTAANAVMVRQQDRVPGVQYLDLQMLDVPGISRKGSFWPNTERDLRKAVAFVEEAVRNGGIVLINCWAGQNRSGSVSLTWLLTHKVSETGDSLGLTPKEAIEHMKAVQPHALSNNCLKKCVLEMLGFDGDGTETEDGCDGAETSPARDLLEGLFSGTCKFSWARTVASCIVRKAK